MHDVRDCHNPFVFVLFDAIDKLLSNCFGCPPLCSVREGYYKSHSSYDANSFRTHMSAMVTIHNSADIDRISIKINSNIEAIINQLRHSVSGSENSLSIVMRSDVITLYATDCPIITRNLNDPDAMLSLEKDILHLFRLNWR